MNFDLFFLFFSEDSQFQQSFTIFPLKVASVSPKTNVSRIESELKLGITVDESIYPIENDEKHFIFPNRQERFDNKLDYYIDKQKKLDNIYEVILISDGTEKKHFRFIWDGCWYLSEIIDYLT